ncbi:MAG: hypothetical protein ACNYPG_06120 [Candidatus Porifericomitaceae bacterium WSBS_2022_MAG_OTU9]
MPQTIIATLLLLVAALPAIAAAGGDAGDHLEMYRKNENVCLQLNRGKMIMLRSTHPQRNIDYRMARHLATVRQGGFTVGSIGPGATEALGCERVDGLWQEWKLLRAIFSDDTLNKGD